MRGGHGKLGESIHEAQFLRVEREFGIIASHLGGILEAKYAMLFIEAIQCADSAASAAKGGEEVLLVQAHGADHTDARDHNTSHISWQVMPFLSHQQAG